MILDELLALAQTLRKRVQDHALALQQNETRTRYALVDPLLKALGWDLEDPDQVVPEYTVGSARRADYALLRQTRTQPPALFIEVKALGRALSEGIDQSINYCIQDGVQYFGVTDGARWEIYDIYKQGPLPDKRIVDFGVTDDVNRFALSALWLWSGNHRSGAPHAVSQAPEPGRMPVDSLTPGEPPTPQPVPPQTTHPIPPPPMVTGAWIPLSQLQPKFFDRPPNSLRFSDGTQATLGNWWKLPVELVGWLATNGILTAAGCPIQHAKRYLVNVSPVHPSGKPFLQDKAVGSFHVETKYSGPDHARNARLILKHLGQDLTKFSVQS